MKRGIGIGFLVWLLVTAFSFFFFMEFFTSLSFTEVITFLFEKKLIGKLLGLAALPNLFVFFVFLKKKQEYRARGVVLASFIVAFLVLIAQFL